MYNINLPGLPDFSNIDFSNIDLSQFGVFMPPILLLGCFL